MVAFFSHTLYIVVFLSENSPYMEVSQSAEILHKALLWQLKTVNKFLAKNLKVVFLRSHTVYNFDFI